MPIPPKYPMTDFHEINLDYLLKKYFEVDAELKAQIGGLVLDNQFNKLRLLDKDGNEITSVTVAFATNATLAQTAVNATNAQNATLAARATEADNADMARYDAAGNQITSYVKSVSTTDNVIDFKDAYNRTIGSVSIVSGNISTVEFSNQSPYDANDAMLEILPNLNVGDSIGFDSTHNWSEINALLDAGNVVNLIHKHTREGETVLDYSDKIVKYSTPYFCFMYNESGTYVRRYYLIQPFDLTDPTGKIKIKRVL